MGVRSIHRVVLPRDTGRPRSPVVRSHRTSAWTIAGLMLVALLLALLMGLGAATGQKLVIIGLAGLAGVLAVLAVPVTWTFWTMIVMSFVIVGPATYFLRLGQLQWLPALFGMALYIQALVMLVTKRAARGPSLGVPAFFYFLVLFWATIAFSCVLAGVSMGELLMASRYYIFVWGALMVFFVGAVDDKMIDRAWRLLLLFTLFQLPLVVYQFLFVAKKRASGEIPTRGSAPPWDAIIGTFPGTDTGGGNSAAMAIFVLVMMVMAIALWRDKHLSGPRAAAVVFAAVGSIGLAEVKAIVLMIPVALALYFRRELLRHPVQSLLAVVGGVLLSGLLLVGYQKIHYDERAAAAPQLQSSNATIPERIMNQLDPEGVNEGNNRVGRIANVFRWWEIQGATVDIEHTLFGYGIGTTQDSTFAVGALVQRFGPDIGRSTLVILLWETGAVGLVLFVALLVSGIPLSTRLARDPRIPALHRTYLGVGAVALVLFVITIPYKPFHVRLTSIQLLIILILGQAYYWWMTIRTAASASAAGRGAVEEAGR